MKRAPDGFTLLEMLLALTLLGLLMVLLGTALSGANRAMLTGERYGQRLDELRSAQNFFHRSLLGVLPLGIKDGDADGAVVFEGSPQRLSFAAGLTSVLGGGIRVHTVERVNSGGAQALQVRFARTPAEGSAPWGQVQLLVRDIRDLRFSYRGRDPRGQRTGWLDTWPWPERLPQAVRIGLVCDGPVSWPTQVVALRLELGDPGAAR